MSLALPLVYTLDYAASASFFWCTYNNSTHSLNLCGHLFFVATDII